MIRKTLILLVLTTIAGSAIWVFRNDWKTDAYVSLVRTGNIRDSVTGNVRVLAEFSYELRSEAQGVAKNVALLPFGKPIDVEANQTLVQLDTKEIRRRLGQTLLSKENFDKRMQATSPTAIQLELEEQELKDLKELAKGGGEAPRDVQKQQNLILRLRAQLEQEKLEFEKEGNMLKTTLGNLEAEMQKTMVKSPIRGEFVSSSIAPGDMVLTNQVLGRINSHSHLIEVSLNEEDFKGMQEGLAAGVTLFSFGNEVFNAKIDRLASMVDPKTGRRKLYLKLDSERKLPTGGAGRAEIIKSVRKQTLIIPRKALVGNSVFIESNGMTHLREVRTGARNLTEVEIIDGVKEGERVITQTPHLFWEGQSVRSSLVDSP
jgi:macrolide-specific efflux system membrane fusion protein